jgi:FkbM family methyltransferase
MAGRRESAHNLADYRVVGIIHCGAWIGEEYVGDKRRLLLFEPQAEAFKMLLDNTVNCPDVECVNAACGASIGWATMHTAHPSNSSSLLRPTGSVFGGSEEVEVTTLDLAMKGRKGYDVLRIDTQGYELEVLRGARKTLKKLKRVELELHNPGTYEGAASLEEVDGFMAEQGWARTTDAVRGLGDVVYEKENR